MTLWDGNLLNGPGDIVIDCILLFALTVAHIPQIARILGSGSINGLSPYSVLFNALFSNMQLANTLLLAARAWPTDRAPVLELIGDRRSRGSKAFGSVLGIVQAAFQRFCSIALVTFFASYPRGGKLSLSAPPSNNFTSQTFISAITFMHAALFLLPAVLIALPKPSPRDWGNDIFAGFSAIFNTWICLLFVVLQFLPQFLELRRISGAPGSLSLLSLGAEAALLIKLGIRWWLRLGAPTWANQSFPLTLWYQWRWLPFNYLIDGVGRGILLAMYLQASSNRGTYRS